MGAKKAGKKKNIVLRVILGILIALILIVGIYFLYVFRTYHRIEDQQDHRDVELLHLLQEIHILLGILYHIGDIEQHISILKG